MQEILDQLENVKKGILSIKPTPAKIGIGITTHNRPKFIERCLEQMQKFAPSGATIVVVDDASAQPVARADHRFDTNVGIARAKNKCLELLYLKGCEHFFLFDDDTWPIIEGWELPYIQCPEPHLNYIFVDFATGRKLNDTIELYRDSQKVAYSHARGCMLYYHRDVLDKVGGMDPAYRKWGFEHPSFSDRIYNAGLTTFRYMDIANSKGLFYSDDEQKENMNSSVTPQDRQVAIKENSAIYNEQKYTSHYIPFIEKKNLLCTTFFTRVGDPQREGKKWDADFSKLDGLIDSLKDTKLVVLHDTDEIVADSDKVSFVKVDTSINPYFQRWISYREYLYANRHIVNKIFFLDGTDVEVLREPDWNAMGDFLYTGEELELLDDKQGWMKRHHPHVLLQGFFLSEGKSKQMLNAGILGGSTDTVMSFIKDLLDFYAHALIDEHFKKKPGAGLGDMGVFNYIAYTKYAEKLRHGRFVCTDFKKEEKNDYSWFRHK